MCHLPGGCTGSFGASLSRRNHSNDHDLVIYHGSSLMFRYTGLAPRWRMLQPQASRTRAARSSDMPRQSERAGLVYVGVAARVKPPECCARACLADGVIVIHTHARDENEVPYYMSTPPKTFALFWPLFKGSPQQRLLGLGIHYCTYWPPGSGCRCPRHALSAPCCGCTAATHAACLPRAAEHEGPRPHDPPCGTESRLRCVEAPRLACARFEPTRKLRRNLPVSSDGGGLASSDRTWRARPMRPGKRLLPGAPTALPVGRSRPAPLCVRKCKHSRAPSSYMERGQERDCQRQLGALHGRASCAQGLRSSGGAALGAEDQGMAQGKAAAGQCRHGAMCR